MATGRIGVTPVLRVRWSDQPTAGTTVLSGLDDNSVALVYDAGYEAVYRNGVLLSRGYDYTATDGTTVTLIDATLATDIIEIFANDLVPLTDAISKGQYNAKGALLSATAASTPAVLAVGTNGQVLTADSTAGTGLAWATAASGGMTSIATGSLTGSSVSITSIPATYKELLLVLSSVSNTNANYGVTLQHNSVTSATYGVAGFYGDSNAGAALSNNQGNGSFDLVLGQGGAEENVNMGWTIRYSNYANTSDWKRIVFEGSYETHASNVKRSIFGNGLQSTTSAITSIQINSNSFDGGTYILCGVN